MEIKVGEYVRTELGTIGKVKYIDYAGQGTRYYGEELTRNYYTIDYNDDNFGRYDDDGLVKHSHNIIDLIEVGDVINYKELFDNPIFETQANETYILNLKSQKEVNGFKMLVKDKEIEFISIVTHEQFQGMEYKVNNE